MSERLIKEMSDAIIKTLEKTLEKNGYGEQDPDYYTRRDVMNIFGICPRTLRNWEQSGRVTPIIVQGRKLFARSSIDSAVSDGSLIRYQRKNNINLK